MPKDWTFPPNDWALLDDGVERYVLLDGAQCDCAREIFQGLQIPVRALFDGRLADGLDDASVLLAMLPRTIDVDRFLRRIEAAARSPGVLSLIESPLQIDALLQRLQRRLDASYPNGKQFISRYFDARVLPWWVQALDEQQRDDFLAIGHRWTYLQHDLCWEHLGLHCPVQEPHDPPWVLEAEQRHALIDASYPYTLIDHFQLTDLDLLQRVPREHWYAYIRKVVAMASAFGIEEGKHVVMVVTWSLLTGLDLAEAPGWPKRLADYASGQRSAADIGNEVWPRQESWV